MVQHYLSFQTLLISSIMQRKYIITAIICLLFLQSCKLFRYSLAEKVTVLDSCSNISLVGNRVTIHTLIEGRDQVMLLDMGSSSSAITDTTAIPDYYKRGRSSFGLAKGADREKLNVVYMPLRIKSKLHQSDNAVFMVVSAALKQNSCSTTPANVGLYGYDLMRGDEETTYLLDFERGEICNLKGTQLQATLAQGYQPIKAEVGHSKITIYVVIEGIEYAFEFDTGYSGTFTMPYNKEKIRFLADPHTAMEGMLSKTVSNIITGTDNYYPKQITVSGKEYKTEITVSQSIKAQNVGMGFIKGFNWVIDFKNKKVYIKKNSLSLDEDPTYPNDYYANESGGKLIVALRRSGSADFAIGDEIIKVNGQEVTAGNRCEMKKLLNNQKDWESLKVLTKKE